MRLPNAAVRRIVSTVEHAELGDLRRNRRLTRVISLLAKRPRASLPDVMSTEADLEAAYRLVNNPHVSPDALHDAHAVETAERARRAGRVLAIHDTTPCQFSHADPAVIGYLNTGKPGFQAHYSLVVDARSHRPLGVTYVEPVVRMKPPAKRRKSGTKRQHLSGAYTRQKSNREFERWERGIAQSDEYLADCEVIHIADRESDSYELMADSLAAGRQFVFRARMPSRGARAHGNDGSVQEFIAREAGVLRREVPLSTRAAKTQPVASKTHPPRKARQATLHYSAMSIELRRPRYLGPAFPNTLPLNLVRVWEPNPPEGETPVEWLLYTTEPVDTAEQIADVVDIYRARWLIEECNKALKSGCLYEHRQFESRGALLTMLALSLPVACEILALRTLARQNPERSASDVLSPLQLRILRKLGSRSLPESPTRRDALLALAALGGHQRSNGEPGWLVLQRGMTKLIDFEAGWRAARALAPDL